nr:MAG TPA: hypothetical protein [Caudoviricetes sp.]
MEALCGEKRQITDINIYFRYFLCNFAVEYVSFHLK